MKVIIDTDGFGDIPTIQIEGEGAYDLGNVKARQVLMYLYKISKEILANELAKHLLEEHSNLPAKDHF